MATWKAEITEKTNLDSNSGQHEVIFKLIRPNGQVFTVEGQVIFRRVTGIPSTIRSNVIQETQRYIAEVNEFANLQVGNQINVEI